MSDGKSGFALCTTTAASLGIEPRRWPCPMCFGKLIRQWALLKHPPGLPCQPRQAGDARVGPEGNYSSPRRAHIAQGFSNAGVEVGGGVAIDMNSW